jgi:hypothetical protein
MTDKFENSFTKHEEFNEANNDSHVAQSVKEILQHAHRHISDAIDCDENNYGESAVRSYSLAMDYFKTYLKMNAIGGSSGGKFGAFRAFARWNSPNGKKTCTKKRSEDVVFLSFTSSSLCVFRSVSSSLCVCFIRRRRRIKMVVCETFVYERGCRREDLSRVSRQSRRFSLLSLVGVLSMFSSLFFLLFLSLLDRIMTDQNLSFITNDNVTQERETRGRNSSRKSFSIRSVYKS